MLFRSEVFGPVYISLIKTGEDAGELDETLSRLLVLLKKQDRIKGKVIGASIYPAILIIILLGVLILFSKLVFPAFYGVIANGGGDIPLYSQMLMNICLFFNHFWWFPVILLGATIYSGSMLFKNYSFKAKWDEFILKVPVVSDFIQYINLANFMSVLHISYDAGLPILSGLELSSKTVGNNVIKRKISMAVGQIKQGKSLTEAFEYTQAIPSPLMPLISTGEKSGYLGKMLKEVADVIDKKVDMTLEALTKLFEPTLIVLMGGIVLFIALGFYQMYFSMLGSLL